jgi:hypothetical protein
MQTGQYQLCPGVQKHLEGSNAAIRSVGTVLLREDEKLAVSHPAKSGIIKRYSGASEFFTLSKTGNVCTRPSTISCLKIKCFSFTPLKN